MYTDTNASPVTNTNIIIVNDDLVDGDVPGVAPFRVAHSISVSIHISYSWDNAIKPKTILTLIIQITEWSRNF